MKYSNGKYGHHTPSSRTEQARSLLPSRELSERMAMLAGAFADTNRLRLLLTLQREPVCVGELALILSLSQSAVSHQLMRLKALGMVRSNREGRHIYYELALDEAVPILDSLGRATVGPDQ